MSKRVTAFIYKKEPTQDEFGGWMQELVLEKQIHATLETLSVVKQNREQGVYPEVVLWLKSHNKISNPEVKIIKINGVNFSIKGAYQNMGRWYYQIDQLQGGDSFAD